MRSLGLARTAAFVAVGLMFAVASHADTAASPWSKVPAFPTNCYQDQDPFYPRLEAAQAAVAADRERQEAINTQVEAQVREADPMELANRVQEKMMKDPQNAAKYIQELQNLGQNLQSTQREASEREMQIQAEEKAVVSRYRDALAKGRVPGDARWGALKKKLGLAPDARGPGEVGVPEWAWKEWHVILREWDRGDQATCAQWWNAGGPIYAYMKRYKDYLLQEHIPHYLKYDEFEAVENYMKLAYRLFSQREYRPRCSIDRCE